MRKKHKNHDTMKTVTERISHSWGYEKITRKEKRTKRMDVLCNKLMQLNEQMCRDAMAISNIEIKEKTLNTFIKTCAPLFAEYDADFLIVNNIARRGKPLHTDTAIKKLAKMRDSAKAILMKYTIKNTTVTDLSSNNQDEKNLYYFLRIKYGVTLMNTHTYNNCMNMIETHNCRADKKAQHYANFAKKFHTAIIKEAKQK